MQQIGFLLQNLLSGVELHTRPTTCKPKRQVPKTATICITLELLMMGVSRQNIRRKMKRLIQRQHTALWRSLCGTQRQDRELISGPNLATGAQFLPFNRTQSRAVIGLLTGHNTLRRHLHVMGLNDNPTYRKCGTEEETSVHILSSVRL